MGRTRGMLLALLLAMPLALAAHPEGSGPRSLGGDQVPMTETLRAIEAESFEDKPVGGRVEDAAATGGAAWEMPRYGVIETTVDLPEAGVVWVEIRARGTHPEGMRNPHMHVNVDGEQRGEWDVFADWLVYRQALPMLAGKHRVGVDNFNNYHAPADDRTLVVDWVKIHRPTLEGTPRMGAGGVLVIDARDLHNSVTGQLEKTDEARGGTQWIQWGIGCFSQMVVLDPGGEHALVPRLRGNVHDGVGTHVIVRVDGREVDEYHVGKEWEERETRFRADAGAHVVDLCYDNDEPGKKRNLWLDEMTLRRLSGGAPAAPAPDWPLAHGNLANTRHAESAIGPGNVPHARVLWSYEADGPVTGTPVHADGVVYFGDHGGSLHAVRAEDGVALWRVDHGAGVDSSLALDDARVYAGDVDGWLSARDRETGELRWRVRADTVEGTHLYGSPVVHEGRVCTGVASEQTLIEYEGPQDFRGSVACFDAATGDLLWRTRVQTEDGFGVSVWSTPAIDPALGLLFVGTGNAYGEPAGPYSDAILALRLADGAIAWRFQATEGDAFNARGAPGPDWDFGSSPVLFEAGGRRLVGEGDKGGRFYALDRATGALVWQAKADFKVEGAPPSRVEGFLGSPAYADGVLFVPTTARSMVHAFDAATGRTLWATELNPLPQRYGDRMFGSATHTGGVVLQGNAHGRLFALDAATGDVLANLSAGGGVQGGVSVAGARVFVPHVGKDLWSGKGGVTAFEVPEGPRGPTAPTESTGAGAGPSLQDRVRGIPFPGWLTLAAASAAASIAAGRRAGRGR